MENEILKQGMTLMLVGLGTVFAFLTILVAATSAMSEVVTRLTSRSISEGASDEEIAAITAAIARHRRQ